MVAEFPPGSFSSEVEAESEETTCKEALIVDKKKNKEVTADLKADFLAPCIFVLQVL